MTIHEFCALSTDQFMSRDCTRESPCTHCKFVMCVDLVVISARLDPTRNTIDELMQAASPQDRAKLTAHLLLVSGRE